MSLIRLILISLRYYWRSNAAVAMGVAAGAAVLTGALLVGDSMRGSLRDLTLDRLGRIDEVLVTETFFREQLTEELAAALPDDLAPCPALLLRATLENPNPTSPKRANRVNLLGCDERFWQLGPAGSKIRPKILPKPREIVLNRPLAKLLDVEEGDSIMLRLPNASEVPSDSPLGRKEDTVDSTRVTVVDIIEAEGLGRFGLRPSQHLPRNAYVSLPWLQDRLEQSGRINAILLAGKATEHITADEDAVQRELRPKLDDYGIRLEKTPRGYFNVTSDRMILSPGVEEALAAALADYRVQPVLTHLANTIACNDRETPYSTLAAVDFTEDGPLGSLQTTDGQPIGPIGDDEVVLNAWAAEDLQATVGDTIRITFFEPETTHGETLETTVELRLAAIAALAPYL